MSIFVPADVPKTQQRTFTKNYTTIMRGKDSLLLFAADQKIEHLNDDFLGTGIDKQANNPEHIFAIAGSAPVGALATQLGMIARYGARYPQVNYIVKLNSKTNLISPDHEDPVSIQLWSIADVVQFQKTSKLSVCGVGYTLYLGSVHESIMLQEAAQIVYQAHQAGLVVILWVYPRGQHVEQSARTMIGAAGVANALGADFVKLQRLSNISNGDLGLAAQAAGNTKVILAGGSKLSDELLLKTITSDLKHKIAGCALGRNLFQRSLKDAVALVKKIANDIII